MQVHVTGMLRIQDKAKIVHDDLILAHELPVVQSSVVNFVEFVEEKLESIGTTGKEAALSDVNREVAFEFICRDSSEQDAIFESGVEI